MTTLFPAQQIEAAAYSSVIIHNIGRCFGVLWVPIYFYVFPHELYGFVFGSIRHGKIAQAYFQNGITSDRTGRFLLFFGILSKIVYSIEWAKK